MTQREIPMLKALYAARPHESLAAKLHLYGRFVGSWKLDIDFHPLNGPLRRAEGEWHFVWVLDGKAIQDVWIFPARRLRGTAEPWHMYGSTFRWYDPAIDAWHITYFDPAVHPSSASLDGPPTTTLCRSAKITTASKDAGDLSKLPISRSAGSARCLGTKG